MTATLLGKAKLSSSRELRWRHSLGDANAEAIGDGKQAALGRKSVPHDQRISHLDLYDGCHGKSQAIRRRSHLLYRLRTLFISDRSLDSLQGNGWTDSEEGPQHLTELWCAKAGHSLANFETIYGKKLFRKISCVWMMGSGHH